MPRQVAHALLTRPPLSLIRSTRRLPSSSSVRLECVMHAASVHPEPGSNSRINCIKITLSSVPIFRAFFLASFTFVWVVFSFRISNEISFALYFFALYFFNLLLFNFQWPMCCISKYTALLVYHIRYHFVKYFFHLSINFFTRFLATAFATLLYYHINYPLSRGFWKFFHIFLLFWGSLFYRCDRSFRALKTKKERHLLVCWQSAERCLRGHVWAQRIRKLQFDGFDCKMRSWERKSTARRATLILSKHIIIRAAREPNPKLQAIWW